MHGPSGAPGDSSASVHANARPDEAELFAFFFFCRILQSNSEKTQIVCGPVRTPGAVVLEAGVLEPVTTQTANQREGGKVATTLRSQRLSHSSQLLTGSRVICD